MFHPRCGHCVSLSNGNKTACRTNPHHEFDRGLVFSLEPIKDNEIFEIKIDRKLNTWSGSVEIGVTVCNPDVIDIPFTATDLRGGTWVLLGHGVLRDGRSVMEAYGCDLDQLVEGDRVGVMRSGHGELEFYVNGESQGVAAVNLPPLLYAVVDMYGKCAQISLTSPVRSPDSNTLEVDSPSAISGSYSGSESNVVPPAAPPTREQEAPQDSSSVPASVSILPCSGASPASRLCSSPQTSRELSQVPEFSSARNAMEERNQLIQLEQITADNRNCTTEASQGAAESRQQGEGGGSRGSGLLDLPVSEEADLLMPLAACSLRNGSDSDGSAEEEEETDAGDKGNEKHHGRSGNSGAARAAPVRDSNIILSNTEQLCRVLNITMESIMSGASGSGTSARTVSSATGASASTTSTRPGCYIPKEPANIAQCDEDICNDSEDGDDDAAHSIVRFNNYGFNSAFVNNTINTIRQSEDHSHRQPIVNGTLTSCDNTEDSNFRSADDQSTSPRTRAQHNSDGQYSVENHDGHQSCAQATLRGNDDCSSICPRSISSNVPSTAAHIPATSNVGSDSSHVAVLLAESNFSQVPCSNPGRRGQVVETRLGQCSPRGQSGGGGATRRSSSGGRRSSASNNSSPYRCGRRSRVPSAAAEGTSNRSGSLNRHRNEVLADTASANSSDGSSSTVPRNLSSDPSGTPVLLSARVRDSSPSSPTRANLQSGRGESQSLFPSLRNDAPVTNAMSSKDYNLAADAGGMVCAVKQTTNDTRSTGMSPGQSVVGNDATGIQPSSEADPASSGGGEGAGGGGGSSCPPPQSSRPLSSGRGAGADRLQFHEKCGMLVRLSNYGRTAERVHPLDEFNNGVVMSNRALRENELFEIRIDRLVDKWSGSIEVGITTHNPATLEFPATMTNLRSGTTMMSGTGILKNGKGMLRQYGDFNLDELQEGDRIGMMIRSGRTLHYFINGLEQGVASTDVPSPVWSVVDLYGMTVKVTLMDRDPRDQQNLLMRQIAQAEDQRSAAAASATLAAPPVSGGAETCGSTDLLFSAECGSSAQVINGGMTAHRPNALEDFNHGVVLTSRPLKPGELLEVRLDQCVYMWAGSLEIGVTTHSPHSFEYPSTMTKVTTGTWMMTGDGGVKHNGTTIINEYGLNLDRLQVGDRAGVVRHADGSLHFFINGADQGVAASGVPETVYGVVDLYGQAAQATIVHGGAVGQSGGSEGPGQQVGASPSRVAAANSATAPGTLVSGRSSHQPQARVRPLQQQVQQQQQQQVPSGTTFYSDLRFHELHGRNASVIRNGLGAERPHADAEFNDAIVISNRQLHEGEMFEVMIEKVVDRWSGSLEAGVTAIHPEDIEFPSTMTDIDYDTWMLSGSSVMMNGVTIKNNYACDLDSLGIGSRIGMMRHADATLHYYVNGVDQGVACTNLPAGIWAVVDLYGQCAQVSIVHNPVNCEQLSAAAATRLADSCKRQQQQQQQQQQQKPDSAIKEQVCHQFSYCHGTGVTVSEGRGALHRTSRQEGAATGRTQASCLAFTNSPLSSDELFEVRITRLDPELRGSIRIGLTTLPMLPNLSIHSVPPSLSSVHPVPPSDTWWVGESNAYHNFCGWKPPILLPGINGQNGLDDTSGTRPTLCRSSHENVTRSVSFADKCGGNSSRMNTAWTVSIAKHDFCPHLSKLVLGDRIGVKRTSDGCMRLYINGFDCGVAATGIQDSNVVLGVVELHGNCIAVETTSYVQEEVSSIGDKTGPQPSGAGATGVVSQDSLELSAVGLTFATEGSAPGSVQPHASTNADVARLAEPQTGSTNPFSSNCLSGGVLPHDVTGGIRYNTRTAFTFSGRHGKNIVLSADRTIAVRKKGYNHGLTVTARPLPRSTMFTAVLNGVDPSFCGGAMLGLLFLGTALSTDNSSLSNTVLPDDLPIAPHSSLPNDMSRSSLGMPDDSCRSSHFPLLEDVPESALDLLIASNCECVLLCGSNVYRGQSKLCSDYGPDLNSVTPGTTLGLCIDAQARLHLFVNGADCGVAAHNIPPNPYVLLDLYGAANEAHIVNCDDASHSGVAEHALKKKTQHNNNQQQQQQSRRQLQQQLHQHSSADGESFVLSNHDEMNLAISRSMNSSAEHVLNSVPATADRHDEVAVCNKNASQNCCNHSTSCLDHDSADHCKALKSCSLDNSTNCNSAFHAIAVSDVNNESVAALNGTSNVADSGTVNAVGCNSSAGAAIALTHASLSTTRTQQNKVKASVRGGDASGKKCAYQRLCGRFLASLSLPGAYFSCDVLCYCDTCHRARGEEAVYTKGNGVEYHRPLGWCRYGLVSGSSDSVCDSWHMAYCAARPGHVRRMLDKGELLFPGELELGFPRRGGRSKEEEGDGSMINVSPSVAVAAATTLPTTGLLERGCGRSYSGRVLLQVAVKPGAYKKLDCENDAAVGSGVPAPAAGVPTAARSAARSDNKPHTRVQWVTKERGATQLLALLVAVEQVEKT